MSDLERLQDKFQTGEFLRPDARLPNVVDLSRAAGVLAGAEGVERTEGALRLAGLVGDAQHLVFVVADGLGMTLVESLPRSSFLGGHLVQELRTVFPSASPVALTSLATGAWPSHHGVTGWWTHLPEIDAAAMLLPFSARNGSRSLGAAGLTREVAFPLPAVMATVARPTLALFPAQLCDSISSGYFSGGRDRRGYRDLPEAIDLTIEHTRRAGGPTFTYLYNPRVDTEAHQYGLKRPEVWGAVEQLDGELARLARRLGSAARIVATADHGLLDTPDAAKHRLRFTERLAACLRHPPTGDARVLFLHAYPDREDALRAQFRERYRDRFLLVSIGEAEGLGLFGPEPISEGTRGRFGDFIAVSAGLDVVEYVPTGTAPRLLPQVSHHSGLTAAEMRVPLIVI